MKKTAMGRAGFALSALTFINLLNYLDRYVIAGALPRVEQSFHLAHGAAGLLGSSFLVVYMVAAPAGGYLGDRMPRRYLISGSVIFWSVATLASGFSRSFGELLLARAALGIGEAGYATAAPALISDLFSKERRTAMLSIFYLAIPLGAAAGYGLGGALSTRYGWNGAFFAVGIPGLVVGLLALLLPEPVRGANEGGSALANVSVKQGILLLKDNLIYVINTLALTLLTFSLGGLAYWMPTFLEKERGMEASMAGFLFGAVTALAGVSGTLVGGVWGDRAEKTREYGGMALSGWGMLAGAPLMFLSARVGGTTLIFSIIFAAQFLLFLNTGPINAAVINSVEPGFRAFAFGLNTLVIHLLGDALSPPLIGWIGQRSSLALAIKLNALPVVLGGFLLLYGLSRHTSKAVGLKTGQC